MKKHRVLVFLLVVALCFMGVAYAAEAFADFHLRYISMSTYSFIVSDTTSKNMYVADNAYARLYITDNNAAYNCLFKTYYNGDASGIYYKKETIGTWMYYTKNVPITSTVYLRGRTDSDEPNTVYITGSFGAG